MKPFWANLGGLAGLGAGSCRVAGAGIDGLS